MNTAVTDSKFHDLRAKLRELFELDKSDLDFGIYRIIAAKNKDVTEFLDRQLKDVVRQTLAAHGAGATEQVQGELDKAVQQAQSLGADPDSLPKVKELKAKLAAAGGASAGELEADIYNHLLAFFGRYYDEGDFISKRRYKGDVYAIPYAGEEVTLHWANKDQYYIKSGEWHKDYRFKLAGKFIRFKLIDATQETNNNKESEDAKRRFVLDADNPISTTDNELIFRFQFRLPIESEKQATAEATRIFGGNYDKSSGRTKGDEREQFCADAERRAIAAMPQTWKSLVGAPAATEGKPARTILGKRLDEFTARNTYDYFIHKDLGGFLRRELDFYIKNEVLRVDDLEALSVDHLNRVQGRLKAIRTVAGRIIDFLASIENFQKKMWLKRKLVLDTNWLVTVDRIPPVMRDGVVANPKQWREWEALGLKPDDADPMLINGPKWGTREYLDANDKLAVDTKRFDREFKADLLACLNDVHPHNAYEPTAVLVNGDNFHAVELLKRSYTSQVQAIYIDPPYNTDAGPILYKNTFRSAAWMSMIADRLSSSREVLKPDGITCVTIDDYQLHELAYLLDQPLRERRGNSESP